MLQRSTLARWRVLIGYMLELILSGEIHEEPEQDPRDRVGRIYGSTVVGMVDGPVGWYFNFELRRWTWKTFGCGSIELVSGLIDQQRLELSLTSSSSSTPKSKHSSSKS